MPIKCYNKPNRKKARPFTAKDVRRIARYANRDGTKGIEIFAGVAAFIGFGWLLCVASKVLSSMAKITKAVGTVLGALGTSQVISWIMRVASGGFIKTLPIPKQIVIGIVILAVFFRNIVQVILSFRETMDLITTGADEIHLLCTKAREIAVETGQDVSKYTDDAIDATIETGQEVIDKIKHLR